jgi:hypothetical protein
MKSQHLSFALLIAHPDCSLASPERTVVPASRRRFCDAYPCKPAGPSCVRTSETPALRGIRAAQSVHFVSVVSQKPQAKDAKLVSLTAIA